MAMRTAQHGGIFKKPDVYSPIDNRSAPDEYGLLSDARTLRGGIIEPEANFNGVAERTMSGSLSNLYVQPITFVPEHGGVYKTPEGYGAPVPGDQLE